MTDRDRIFGYVKKGLSACLKIVVNALTDSWPPVAAEIVFRETQLNQHGLFFRCVFSSINASAEMDDKYYQGFAVEDLSEGKPDPAGGARVPFPTLDDLCVYLESNEGTKKKPPDAPPAPPAPPTVNP